MPNPIATNPGTTSAQAPQGQNTNYWTPARMASATPMGPTVNGGPVAPTTTPNMGMGGMAGGMGGMGQPMNMMASQPMGGAPSNMMGQMGSAFGIHPSKGGGGQPMGFHPQGMSTTPVMMQPGPMGNAFGGMRSSK